MYELNSIIATYQPIKNICNKFNLRYLMLQIDIYMIPMIKKYHKIFKLHDNYPEWGLCSEFLLSELIDNSKDGIIAYVEALYHGGTGSKNAVIFEGQVEKLRIINDHDAINKVLKYFKISPNDSKDEFEYIKLNKYRDTEDWIKDFIN